MTGIEICGVKSSPPQFSPPLKDRRIGSGRVQGWADLWEPILVISVPRTGSVGMRNTHVQSQERAQGLGLRILGIYHGVMLPPQNRT